MKILSPWFRSPSFARTACLAAAIAFPIAFSPVGAAWAGDERPKYQVLRQNEDWSFLKDYEGEGDFFDPAKYVPLNDNGDIYFSFGAQLRSRLEGFDGFNFGNTGAADDDDVYLLHRLLVHADLQLGEHVRFFLQGINATLTDRDLPGGERTIDENELDFQNAFVEFNTGGISEDVGNIQVRVGRQGLLFGAQRLVSPLDWANSQRMFHAATVSTNLFDWNTTAFGSELVKVKNSKLDKREKDTNFYGLYGTNKSIMGLEAFDLYYLYLDNESVAWNGTTGDEDRHTLGGRLHGDIGGSEVFGELEAAYQFGEVGSDDISAFMVTGLVDWDVQPMKPKGLHMSVGGGYASGDDSTGGKVKTFNQLFPLGHKYLGYIDAVGRQNIINMEVGASMGLFWDIVGGANYLHFWRADKGDALYNAGGGVAIAGQTNGKREVGGEIDLTLKRAFGKHLSVLAGYSHFFAGDFVDNAPEDDDIDFGYLQLQYTM